MESDFDATASSPEALRATLHELAADREKLAEHAVTPGWYYPALGGLLVILVLSQGFGDFLLPMAGALVTIFGALVLVRLYTKRYGVWITQTAGPRSKTLLVAMMAGAVLCVIGAVVLRSAGAPFWWLAVPAVLVFCLIVVLGPCYDRVWRREWVGREHG